jgi:hypothetical protein
MTGICRCIASRSQRLSARCRVGAHELVIDDIITRVDLAMSLALIIIPDPSTLSGKYGSDGQQPGHLLGLEDPAFRVDG